MAVLPIWRGYSWAGVRFRSQQIFLPSSSSSFFKYHQCVLDRRRRSFLLFHCRAGHSQCNKYPSSRGELIGKTRREGKRSSHSFVLRAGCGCRPCPASRTSRRPRSAPSHFISFRKRKKRNEKKREIHPITDDMPNAS